MPFNLTLAFNSGNASQQINNIQTGLTGATKATGQARDAMGRFTAGANAAGAAGAAAGAQVTKGMNQAAAATQKAAAAAEGHGDSLSKLIHLTEAYIGLHVAESVIDGYVEIRNKTNSVSTSTENLNALMDEQFRIAQETRSSWEGLASTYQRIANAGRGLGLSQRQIIDLTEELSMGLRLSGSSAFEANMTMMELTHAFTVGALTGREFRVMMKDAPALMHELQVVSGKTGAEFAEMGKHGKFTAAQLVEWFGKAKEAIAEKFGQTIPTIGEGFILIRNAAQKFFGEAGLGTGVVQSLGIAMRFLAEHMETIGKAALGVAEAFISMYVIEKVIGMIKALTVAIAANPLGALFTALVVGISLLRQFGDSLETSRKIWSNVGNQFVTVGDNLRALWQQLKTLGTEILKFVSEAWNTLTGAVGEGIPTDKIEDSLSSILRMVSGFVGAIRGIWQVLSEDTHKTFQIMNYWITTLMIEGANAAIRAIEAIAAAPRRALFDMMNKTEEKRAAAFAATRQEMKAYDPGTAGFNAVLSESRKAVGWGPYGSGAASADQVAAEFRRRLANIEEAQQTYQNQLRGLNAQGEDERNGRYRLFGDIKNPLAGSAEEKIAKEALNDIKYEARKSMEEFDKMSRDIAAKRTEDERLRGKGEVSTIGGKPDAKPVDEKEKKALETLKNQLRTVTEATNPQAAAIEKLSHAHEVLQKSVEHTLITQDEAQRRYDLYAKKLEDEIHPFEAWTRKQQEATDALRDNADEQERAAKLTSFIENMRQKTGGVGASEVELALETKRIELAQRREQQMHAEQAFTQAILGPQKIYQTNLAALGDLLERGRITSEQYGIAIEGVRAAYLAAATGTRTLGSLSEEAWLKAKEEARGAGVAAKTYAQVVDEVRAKQLAAGPEGKTFLGALEAGWLKAKLDAESFGATVAGQVLGGIDKLNDAFVTMANGGEVSWGKMIDAMIQDLERLILKQLEVAAINAIITGLTGGVPVPGAGETVAGSNGLINPYSSSARTGPAAYPTTTGATQSSTVANSYQGPPQITIVNQMSEDVGVAGLQTRRGQQIQLNTIRANGGGSRR